MSAAWAQALLCLIPVMDQQVSDIGNPCKGISESKDRVAPVKKGVAEQQCGTDKA